MPVDSSRVSRMIVLKCSSVGVDSSSRCCVGRRFCESIRPLNKATRDGVRSKRYDVRSRNPDSDSSGNGLRLRASALCDGSSVSTAAPGILKAPYIAWEVLVGRSWSLPDSTFTWRIQA